MRKNRAIWQPVRPGRFILVYLQEGIAKKYAPRVMLAVGHRLGVGPIWSSQQVVGKCFGGTLG
jgi:hypothetical protein